MSVNNYLFANYFLDFGYTNAFLMTFHLFGTSTQLFDELKSRFMIDPPDDLSPGDVRLWVEMKLSPVQLKVCSVYQSWLENYWIESKDDICLDQIYAFASSQIMQYQPAYAERLKELSSNRVRNIFNLIFRPRHFLLDLQR